MYRDELSDVGTVLHDCRRDLVGDVATILAQNVIPRNPDGFTFDIWTLDSPRFHPDVFIVSLEGRAWIGDRAPSEHVISLWLLANFSSFERPTNYVGGWKERGAGRFHLDVSVPVRGQPAALKVAAAQQQSCIYHPASSREIHVPQTLPTPHRRVA